MSDSRNLDINIRATNTSASAIKQLESQIAAADAQIRIFNTDAAALGRGMTANTAAAIASLEKMKEALKADVAAIREQTQATQTAAAATAEATRVYETYYRTLQQGIDASLGLDRAISSASASAKVLATSLSAAAEADARFRDGEIETARAANEATAAIIRQGKAVKVLSGEAFFGAFNRRQGIGAGETSAAASAAAFQQHLGPAGTGITAVETRATIESLQGVNRELLSARDSAAAFTEALGPAGQGIVSRATKQTINDVNGIGRAYLNAADSAAVFQRVLGPVEKPVVGTAVKTVETKGTIETLQGLNRELLSAKDSAAAFVAELGPAGLGIVSASTQQTINDVQGIGREMLSAKASAEVFARELGPVLAAESKVFNTSALETINRLNGIGQGALSAAASAAVFERELGEVGGGLIHLNLQRTINDLHGINREFLSAADSAAVFVAAETEAERVTRLAAAADAAQAERNAIRAARQVLPEGAHGGGGQGTMGYMRHGVALVDEMSRGNRGAMMSTLGAAARDAGLGVAGLATSMAALIAVMAGGEILRGASEMGKMATELRASASAAGMGLGSYQELSGAFQLIGLKGNEADTTLRHLATSLATAIADPASKDAQAFHNLGISQDELTKTGGNTSDALKLLSKSFVENADSANKTENMSQVLGRGFQKLIPALQGGSEGFAGLTQKAREMGLVLSDEAITTLEKTGEKADELSTIIKVRGIEAFVAWGPAIRGVINILEGLGNTLGKIISLVGSTVNALNSLKGDIGSTEINAAGLLRYLPGGSLLSPILPNLIDKKAGPGVVPEALPKGTRDVPALEPKAKNTDAADLRAAADTAALAAGQGIKDPTAQRIAENKAYLNVLEQTRQAEAEAGKSTASLDAEIAAKKLSIMNEETSQAAAQARKGAAEATKAAKQSYQDFAASERQKVAEAQGNSNAILAIYKDWAEKAASIYKQSAATITDIQTKGVQEATRAQLDEIMAAKATHDNQVKLTMLQDKAAQPIKGQQEVAGQGGPQQIIAAANQAVAQLEAENASYIASLQQVMATTQQGSDVHKKAADEIMRVETQLAEEEISIKEKAAEASAQAMQKAMQPITSFVDEVGSQFESLTSSVLKDIISPQVTLLKQGLTTIKINDRGSQIKQALAKFSMDLVTDAAKSLEDAASKSLASMLSSALNIPLSAAGGGLSSLVTGGLTKLFSNVTGQAAGSAVGGVASGGVSAASSAATITTPIVSSISASSAAQTAAISTAAAEQTASSAANAATIVTAITTAATAEDALLSASAVNPSIAGFKFSQGGIVPSAAGGMVVGGNGGQLAIVHEQEMVLPKSLSNGIQGLINGKGGNTFNINSSPTVNASSRGRGGTGMSRAEMQQVMAQHGGALAGEARNLVRNNGVRG